MASANGSPGHRQGHPCRGHRDVLDPVPDQPRPGQQAVPGVAVRTQGLARSRAAPNLRYSFGTLAGADTTSDTCWWPARARSHPISPTGSRLCATLGIRRSEISRPGESPPKPSRPILGMFYDIEATFHTHVVDEAAVSCQNRPPAYTEPLSRLAADEGKTVRIPVDPRDDRQQRHQAGRNPMASWSARWFTTISTRSVSSPSGWLISAGALVGLVSAEPSADRDRRRDTGAPRIQIAFRQIRVGLHGRPFTIVKFRTMVPDAEARSMMSRISTCGRARVQRSNDPRSPGSGLFLRGRASTSCRSSGTCSGVR